MRSPTTRAIVGLLLLTGVATWGAKQTGFLTGALLQDSVMQFQAQSPYAQMDSNGTITIPPGSDIQLDWSDADGYIVPEFLYTNCYLFASREIDGLHVNGMNGAYDPNTILDESSSKDPYGVYMVRNITEPVSFSLKCLANQTQNDLINYHYDSVQTINVQLSNSIDTSVAQPFVHRPTAGPPAPPIPFTVTVKSGNSVSGPDGILDTKAGSDVTIEWTSSPSQIYGCWMYASDAPAPAAVIPQGALHPAFGNNDSSNLGKFIMVKNAGSLSIPNIQKSISLVFACGSGDSVHYFLVVAAAYVQPEPQCNDGKDNDNDGLTDFPSDTDCTSAIDNTEAVPYVPPASSSSSATAGAQNCSAPDAGYCGPQGCADGLIAYGSHTYLRYDTAAISWQSARTHCQGIGGDLVSIASPGEQGAVYSGLVGTGRSDLWIGLSDTANEGSFKLSDGSTPTYTNFYPGNPDDGYSNEDCVEMNYADYAHDGRWNDFPCDNGYGLISGFICELPQNCGATSSAGMNCSITNPSYCGPKGCPAAFAQYQGHEYTRYDTAAGSWQDARSHCQATGGDLVTIGSSGEQAMIFGNFMGGNRHDVWIGLTDSAQEGAWKWVDGTTPSYVNWHPGEPDSMGPLGDQDCGQLSHLNFAQWDGKWSDGNCPDGEGLNTGFICEYSNQCGTGPSSAASSAASSAVPQPQCNDGIDNDGDGAKDALKETPNNGGTERTFMPEEVRLALNGLGSALTPSQIPQNAAVASTLETGIAFCEKVGMQIRSVAGVDQVYYKFFNVNYDPVAAKQYGWNGSAFVLNGDPHPQHLIWVKCAELSSIQCGDGLDNDSDQAKDFPSDAGCASVNDASELPHDLDCDSLSDITEGGNKGNSVNEGDARPGFGGIAYDGNDLVFMPQQSEDEDENGKVLVFGPSFKPATCGDGVLTSNEQCDDGNLLNGDACNSNCIWGPYAVAGGGSCGDGQCVLPEVPTILMQSAYVPGSNWVLCPADCDAAAPAAAGASSSSPFLDVGSSSSAFSLPRSSSSMPFLSESSLDSWELGGCTPGTICPNNAACPASGVCPGACRPGTLCPTGNLCPESGFCPFECTPGTLCANGAVCLANGACPAAGSSSSAFAPALLPAAGDECIPGSLCEDGQPCTTDGECLPPQAQSSESSVPPVVAPAGNCDVNADCPSGLCLGGVCTDIPGVVVSNGCGSNADCPSGMMCANGACVPMGGICGNGRIEEREACDDGNRNENDGCTTQCRFGMDSRCVTPLQCQSLICTNGFCGTCTDSMQCPDDMICNASGMCVNTDGSAVLAENFLISPELAALIASNPGLSVYDNGTTGGQYQHGGAPQHAPVGNTGPESVAIMAAGASAGYTWMKMRSKRQKK